MTGTTHTTICRFCHAYCGIEVDVEDNRVRRGARRPEPRGLAGLHVREGTAAPRAAPRPGAAPRHVAATIRTVVSTRSRASRRWTRWRRGCRRSSPSTGPGRSRSTTARSRGRNVSFALGLSWLEGIGSPSFYTTVTVDQPAKSMAGALHGYWQGGLHRIEDSDVVLFVGTNPLQSFLVEGVKLPCPNALDVPAAVRAARAGRHRDRPAAHRDRAPRRASTWR